MGLFYPLGSPFSGPTPSDGSMIPSLGFGPQPTPSGGSTLGGGGASANDANISISTDGNLTDVFGFTMAANSSSGADTSDGFGGGGSTSDPTSEPYPIGGTGGAPYFDPEGNTYYEEGPYYPMTGPRG